MPVSAGKRIKILFIIPSLKAGGSERVIAHLVNNLDKRKFELILVVINGENIFYEISEKDVIFINLNKKKIRKSIINLLSIIRRTKPSIIMSTLGHLNIMLAVMGSFFLYKSRLVARESSIVSINARQSSYPTLFNWLTKIFYNRFDAIICQSQYMKNDLASNFGVKNSKLSVINNPVEVPINSRMSTSNSRSQENKKVILVTIGRLSTEKGYDRIIHALCKLNFSFDYYIVGDGRERNALEVKVMKLGLSAQVHFEGQQGCPFKYLTEANLFIQGSYYEGFPNVLLEAGACGLPVVAFNCPGGTSEIIKEGFNGFLAEDGNIEDFIRIINKALDHPFDKKAIQQYTTNTYGVGKITKQYEDLFSNLARCSPSVKRTNVTEIL